MAIVVLYFGLFIASFYPLIAVAETRPLIASIGWIIFLILLTYGLLLRNFTVSEPKEVLWRGKKVYRFPLLGCRTPMPRSYHLYYTILNILSRGGAPGYRRGAWFRTLYVGKKGIYVRNYFTRFIPYGNIRTVRVMNKEARCDICLTDDTDYGFSFYRQVMRNAFVKMLRQQQISVSKTDFFM